MTFIWAMLHFFASKHALLGIYRTEKQKYCCLSLLFLLWKGVLVNDGPNDKLSDFQPQTTAPMGPMPTALPQ